MPLIRLDKASVAFGSRPLLEKVDFLIDPGERVGLVGLNGAGKSTLMKVITKDVHLDGGEVWIDPSCKISVLNQILPAADDRSVWDVVAQGLSEAVALRKEYDSLVDFSDAASLKKLEILQMKLEAVDGWMLEQKVERVLTKLKLDGNALMSSLSGGWRRRAALGAALVTEPDLLLLDEPTNHLDITTIEWLEKQLLDFKGGLLFVSHDRSMVNSLATRIVELDRGILTSFVGNYERYVEQKDILLEQESRNNALFDKRLAEEEVWIRQGIKARRTRNEGRVRALESLRVERTNRLDRQGKAKFSFEEASKSGKLVASLEGVNLNYGDKKVICNLDLDVQRGDRIGLIGPNGAEILLEFNGTVLLVSHDRSFLDNVVTSSLVFEGDGRISAYVGGYKDWLRQRPVETPSTKTPVLASTKKSSKVEQPTKKKLSYKLQQELDQMPKRLEAAELELQSLQEQASSADFYQGDSQKVAKTLEQLAAAEVMIEDIMERWVELED